MPRDLDGRAVVVTGSETAAGAAVAGALAGAGARVERVAGELVLAGWEQARAEVAACAARSHGLDLLVHCAAPVPGGPPLVRWERAMGATLGVLQGGHAAMRGRGGRIVVVVAAGALHGDGEDPAGAMAAEGQRLLARSAARQWRSQGIDVSSLALGRPAPGPADVAAATLALASAPGADVGVWA